MASGGRHPPPVAEAAAGPTSPGGREAGAAKSHPECGQAKAKMEGWLYSSAGPRTTTFPGPHLCSPLPLGLHRPLVTDPPQTLENAGIPEAKSLPHILLWGGQEQQRPPPTPSPPQGFGDHLDCCGQQVLFRQAREGWGAEGPRWSLRTAALLPPRMRKGAAQEPLLGGGGGRTAAPCRTGPSGSGPFRREGRPGLRMRTARPPRRPHLP